MKCIQPIILNSMYCKVGIAEMAVILQNLATLRPEIVIPPLVERLYLALETLTEPHKLTASMHAVVSVSRFEFRPFVPLQLVPIMELED